MAAITSSPLVNIGRLQLPAPENVIADFWGIIDPKHQLFNGQMSDSLDITPYLDYYRRQWNAIAADADGRYVTVRSHDDIVEIVQRMKQGEPKESIIQYLTRNRSITGNTEACDNSVNLAARVLLMLKIGVVKHQAVPRRCLTWDRGSLADFAKESFREPPILVYQNEKLPRSFNAWSINVVSGIRIEFTDNMRDHLLLLNDDTKILIFHHASFLECQNRSVISPCHNVFNSLTSRKVVASRGSGGRNSACNSTPISTIRIQKEPMVEDREERLVPGII